MAGIYRSVTIAERIEKGLRQRGAKVRVEHLGLGGHYGIEEYSRIGADER